MYSYEQKQQTNSTAEIDPNPEWQSISLVYHWNKCKWTRLKALNMWSNMHIRWILRLRDNVVIHLSRLSHCVVWIFNRYSIWSIWTSSKQWLICWWIINTWRNRKSLLWLMHSWCCWKRVNLIQELGSILKKTYQCLKRFCLIQQLQPKSVRKYNGC